MKNAKLSVVYSFWSFKLCFILLNYCSAASAQDTINLYLGKMPNSRVSRQIALPHSNSPGIIYDVTTPSLQIYLPEEKDALGTAVIICPGGGYKVLTFEAEGVRTAKEFARHGIAAFVLKYRLPNDSTMVDKKIGPLQDAQQAIKLLRERPEKWKIDPARIGIMGFSAGGHLAVMAATHFENPEIDNADHISLRPDFLIAVYPVISMQPGLTHPDSKLNLLGINPSKTTVDYFSGELQVKKDMPPVYLTHAGDEALVDVDNSIAFYEQLRHNHVPAELHLYPTGGHGFVLAQQPQVWMAPLFLWLNNNGLMHDKHTANLSK